MANPRLHRQIHSPKYWRYKKQSQRKNLNKAWFNGLRRRQLFKFFFTVFLIVVVFGFIGIATTFAWLARDLPEPGRLQDRLLAETTKIYDRTGQHLLYEIHGDQNRTFIPLEEIPDYTKFAFIALEDKNFWQHKGLSLKHIVKAVFLYGFKKLGLYDGLVPGGSTLTQQFVKNSILTQEKTITRKFKEWILSYQIEKKYSKEQILELYFNEIPFGSTAYGIESAAQTYFAKSARELTLAESSLLAAMIQAPTYYSPFGSHVDELFGRQHFVLNEMINMGYITEEEAAAARETELEFKQSLGNIKAPHFVLYVKELLTSQLGERLVEQGGLRVYTTLDYFKQEAAEQAIAEQAEKNQAAWQASNAALVSLDPKTGEILALVGSRDFFNEEIDGQVNVALRPRQPGSSFKPIVYTTAWRQGYRPETVVFDVVTKFKTEIGKDYEPHNYDDKERGPISLQKALQGSLNIPAVKTLYLTGVNNVLDLAEKLGYTTLSDRSRFGLSLVLGGGEVKLLEHVAAFGVLAREGLKQPTVFITKVEDNKGDVLLEFKPTKAERVLEPEIARITNYTLANDSARAFIFGANSSLTLPDRPVAAKTGTTNDYRDAWAVGYTPSLVTGVWVGNNDNSEMKRGADGSIVAAPIWRKYMEKVLTGSPVETFKTPEYKLPEKTMLNGQVGSQEAVEVDILTGQPATPATPAERREMKIFRVLHSILYYVDKNDPLGPEPGNQSSDIQFENWENAIAIWAEKQNIKLKEEINKTKPTNQTDGPWLAILEPWPEQQVEKNFSIRIEWSSQSPLEKIEFYIDDILQITRVHDLTNPLIQAINLADDFSEGEHYLKVVFYDEAGKSNLVSEKIIIK